MAPRLKASPQAWYAFAAITFFLLATKLPDWIRTLDFFLSLKAISSYLANGLIDLVLIGFCFLGLAVAHRFGPRQALRELGLHAPPGRAFAFALLCSLPMLLAFAVTGTVNPALSFEAIFRPAITAPFVEELAFRGYLFGQLYKRARWGFWPASLSVGLIFGLAHIWSPAAGMLGIGELGGIVLITGLGSVLFGWLLIRWQFNLWVPIALHMFMNLWWDVFAVDETALGGTVANVARLLTVGLAIVLTIYRNRIWRDSEPEATGTA